MTNHNNFDGLPRSPESERVILGAILLDQSFIGAAAEKLQPADFYDANHQQIFKVMLSLAEAGKAIDAAKHEKEASKSVVY